MTMLIHLVRDHVPGSTDASTNGHMAVFRNGYGSGQPKIRSTVSQMYDRQSLTENSGCGDDDWTRDCSRMWSNNKGVEVLHTLVCFFRGLSASALDLLGRVVCGVPRREC